VCLSALHGATIFRVARDDLYISNMMELMKLVHQTFIAKPSTSTSASAGSGSDSDSGSNVGSNSCSCDVLTDSNGSRLPKANWFSSTGYASKYDEFLEHTKKIARSSSVAASIKQTEVQRSKANSKFFL
jgi:hypothetical protein